LTIADAGDILHKLIVEVATVASSIIAFPAKTNEKATLN
jgi:hypothetical protein